MDSAHKTVLIYELSKLREVTFVRYGSPEATLVLDGFAALATIASSLSLITSTVSEIAEGVSFTFPSIGGTVIYLSKNALSSDMSELCTICHELTHADQIRAAGSIQAAKNYLLSGPNRAKLEADADGAAMFCAYLFGFTPDVPKTVEHLRSRLYHLTDAEIQSATTSLDLHLASMMEGATPSITVAEDLLAAAWKVCPELIVPEAFKP